MSQMEVFDGKSFPPSRTKQAFKEETDVNRLVARAARGESLSHLEKHGAVYGDFSDFDDLLTAYKRIETAKGIFAELPGELRREFRNDPFEFFAFVNDPENVDRLETVLPALAAPGKQTAILNDPGRKTDPEPPAAPAAPSPAPAGAQEETSG